MPTAMHVLLAFLLLAFALPATAQQDTIVDVAIGSADHTTLVSAIQAADLAETLSADGPYTVFAPVNSAFDALPQGTVASLLLPENCETSGCPRLPRDRGGR